MTVNKIRIHNDKLWDISQNGEDIDQWLIDNIGYGNYKEWISAFGNSQLPYRSFSFVHDKYETLFLLRWG